MSGQAPDRSKSLRQVVDPEVLARVGGLGLRARLLAEGALQGQHRSPHRGASVEFAQHREYTPGDELKHLDWKAYARQDRYVVKQFEDETNLRVFLLVDTSNSMNYGAPSKLDFGATVAAALAGETKIAPALEHLSEAAGRRAAIYLVSDLLDFDPRTVALLRELRRRRHKVQVLHVLHPDEVRFPFEDLTLFEALETAEEELADPRGMRDQYLEEMRAFCEDLRRRLGEGDVGYRRVETTEPIDTLLLELLSGRAG